MADQVSYQLGPISAGASSPLGQLFGGLAGLSQNFAAGAAQVSPGNPSLAVPTEAGTIIGNLVAATGLGVGAAATQAGPGVGAGIGSASQGIGAGVGAAAVAAGPGVGQGVGGAGAGVGTGLGEALSGAGGGVGYGVGQAVGGAGSGLSSGVAAFLGGTTGLSTTVLVFGGLALVLVAILIMAKG